MSQKIKLSIPTPCHENWHTMSPIEKGKFCAVYQKTVQDFTHASDYEIYIAYQNDQNLCGRFLKYSIR